MRRLLLASLLLVPAAAAAQPAHVELTPFVGYRLGGELDDEETRLFDRDVELEESPSFGLVLDVPLFPNLALELLASRQPTEFRASRDLFGDDEELGDVDVTYLHAGVLWYWGAGQVQPFFAIAAGLTEIAPDIPGADDAHRLSGSLAGGARIFIDRHLGFRFEGRGYWTAIDDDDDCCRRRDEGEADLYQAEGSVGLILAW